LFTYEAAAKQTNLVEHAKPRTAPVRTFPWCAQIFIDGSAAFTCTVEETFATPISHLAQFAATHQLPRLH
jgi:hypothetical protein